MEQLLQTLKKKIKKRGFSIRIDTDGLNESQRAMVGAYAIKYHKEYPTLKPTGRVRFPAAKLAKSSPRGIDRANYVLRRGSNKIIKCVKEGNLSLSLAQRVITATSSKEEQDKALRNGVKSMTRKFKGKGETRSRSQAPKSCKDLKKDVLKTVRALKKHIVDVGDDQLDARPESLLALESIKYFLKRVPDRF